MAVDTKMLAFGIIVGAMILSITYHLSLPSPTLRPTPCFPVRSPPEIPNTPVEPTFKQSVIKTIYSLIDIEPERELSESSDKSKPISDTFSDSLVVATMRKERQNFILHAAEHGINLTAGGTFFQLFPPKFTCPYKKERLGGPKYGKWACGIRELYGLNKSDLQSPPNQSCVMYSLGVGPEIDFDEAVLKITNCKVFAYDHTVNGLPSKTNESRDPQRMVYQKIGVEEYKNQNTTNMKSIKELMKINGHDWMDILKVDVEGAEYGSLNMLMNEFEDSGILPFDQLLVEVHAHGAYSVRDKVIPWFNRLEAMGLRAVHAENNPSCVCFEYNFVNVRGNLFRNSTYSFFQNGWTDMRDYEVKKIVTTPPPSSTPRPSNWFNLNLFN